MASPKIAPDDLKNLQKAIENLTNSIVTGNLFGNTLNDNNQMNNARNYSNDFLKAASKRLRDQEKNIKGQDLYAKLERRKIRQQQRSVDSIRKYGYDKIAARAAVVNGIAEIGKSVINIIVAFGERDIALKKAAYEYQAKTLQINLERESKIIAQGMKSFTSGFTKNAVEVAYDFTKAGYDIGKTNISTTLTKQIAEKQLSVSRQQANIAFAGAMTGSIATILGTSIGLAIAGPIGAAVGMAIGGVVTHGVQSLGGLSVKRAQLELEIQEKVKETSDSFLENFQKFTESWDDLYKQTTDFVLKVNDASRKFSVSIGYIGDEFGETFANTMINMSQEIMANGKTMSEVFGKEMEKLPQIMDSYMQASSRAVNMSAQDYGNIMGTGRLFGMSSEEASSLYGSMNIFNASISSASDSMGIMYHQITRMGLSSKKFGKDLVENLKLAQKYNFKGGVDNMMKLTKWAQQTRFNLNSAASFADSIMNDSLSGALEKAAKLQVLGGSAAIYSDPLGMLYDAGADVGNMAERMASMFNDITGTFNRKTGETEFNWYENRMLAARAQAMGMDVGEVRNMIRQNQKQGVINRELRGSGLSKEDKLAIGNRATYNQDKRRWEVTDIRGEVHDIQDYANGKANIEDLLPADTQEAILEVAEKSLSHLESLDKQTYYFMTKLGVENIEDIYGTVDTQREDQRKLYENNWDKVNQIFDMARQHNEAMSKLNLDIMQTGLNQLDLLKNIWKGYEIQVKELMNAENINLIKTAADKWATSTLDFINFIRENVMGKQTSLSEAVEESKKAAKKDFDNLTVEVNEAYKNKDFGRAMALENARNADASVMTGVHVGPGMHFDGYGFTNGGMITGASNVKSINDGGINVRTAYKDQYLAAMPNGPIDKILQQLIPGLQALLLNDNRNSNSNSANINVNGKLELSQDGSTLNLVELIKNNPAMGPQFIYALMKALGKPVYNTKFLG